MNNFSIKYKYALSKTGEVVCIDSLDEKDRIDYVCLECEDILRPVLGKIRKKHFRHKFQKECSPESYLHKIGKKLFIKKYSECLNSNSPYIIELETPTFCNSCQYGPCTKDGYKTELDLTKYFKSIKEEVRDQDFIPDILLENKYGEKIYIEIAYTHRSSEKKISSGERIVEFIIQKEDDLEIFQSNKIFSSEKVIIYNFKEQEQVKEVQLGHNCPVSCLHTTGKQLFIKKYKEYLSSNIPYNIEYEVRIHCNSCEYNSCEYGTCQTIEKDFFNLTKKFRSITEAQRNEKYYDIILETESGERIYIKISIHPLIYIKISIHPFFLGKATPKELKIIEFILVEEKDLYIFQENKISIIDKTRYHNFAPNPKIRDLKNQCKNKIHYFEVYSNGKCRISSCLARANA